MIPHLLLSLHLFLAPPASPVVSVDVTTTSTVAAPLRLAVYRSAEDFRADRSVVGISRPLEGRTTIDLELPGAGRYVFAAFQDLNGNGKLDKNFLGVPTEPYGFTETPPSKWRTPEFGEIATEIGTGRTDRTTIHLRQWSEY